MALSGATPARTLPGRTFPSEVLLIFCCCFPNKKVEGADPLPGLRAGGRSRIRGSLSRESSPGAGSAEVADVCPAWSGVAHGLAENPETEAVSGR